MKKRPFSVAVAIVILILMFSATAFADQQEPGISLTALTEEESYILYYNGTPHEVAVGTVVSRTYNNHIPAVWILQEALCDYSEYFNYSSMNPGTPDGWFGYNTENAVKAFQGHCSLTVDGWVGHNTWTALANCVNSIN